MGLRVPPVFQRELLAGSRDPLFRHLRLAAAAVSALVLYGSVQMIEDLDAQVGRRVFSALNTGWWFALWVIGVPLTAQAIARERREGTFGLILLTALRPVEVVTSKAGVHVLRLAVIWLAGVPASVVPLALGGVSFGQVLLTVLLHVGAGAGALGAGLMASASVADPRLALRQAWALGSGLMAVQAGLILTGGLVLGPNPGLLGYLFAVVVAWLAVVAWVVLTLTVAVQAAGRQWLNDLAGPPVTRGATALTVGDAEDQAKVAWWRHGPGRRIRGRAPWLWLRLRESGRLELRWIWILAILPGWFGVLATERSFPALLTAVLLVGIFGVTASRGYRADQREGSLELLLVVPGAEGSLLRAHLRGVVRTFLPALLVQLVAHGWIAGVTGRWLDAGLVPILWVWLSLLMVPAYGLWVSARVRPTWLSAVLTAGLACGPSLLVSGLIGLGLASLRPGGFGPVSFRAMLEPWSLLAVQGGLGLLMWREVRDDLRQRELFLQAPDT